MGVPTLLMVFVFEGPVLLNPVLDEFFLPLLSPGEIFRVLSFLQGVPIVEYPIWNDSFSTVRVTTDGIGD